MMLRAGNISIFADLQLSLYIPNKGSLTDGDLASFYFLYSDIVKLLEHPEVGPPLAPPPELWEHVKLADSIPDRIIDKINSGEDKRSHGFVSYRDFIETLIDKECFEGLIKKINNEMQQWLAKTDPKLTNIIGSNFGNLSSYELDDKNETASSLPKTSSALMKLYAKHNTMYVKTFPDARSDRAIKDRAAIIKKLQKNSDKIRELKGIVPDLRFKYAP